MPNEIPAALHNGSNHDYHFIIKNLANEFENTGKYKAFSVPIEKKKLQILIKVVIEVLSLYLPK